jgi:hypothetical protein
LSHPSRRSRHPTVSEKLWLYSRCRRYSGTRRPCKSLALGVSLPPIYHHPLAHTTPLPFLHLPPALPLPPPLTLTPPHSLSSSNYPSLLAVPTPSPRIPPSPPSPGYPFHPFYMMMPLSRHGSSSTKSICFRVRVWPGLGRGALATRSKSRLSKKMRKVQLENEMFTFEIDSENALSSRLYTGTGAEDS